MNEPDEARIGARGLVSEGALAGERVLVQWPANRSQGRRAVGGALFLTTSRLVFCPSTFERWLRGLPLAGRLDEVVGVAAAAPTGSLFDGGLVWRLSVHLAQDGQELFVVDTLFKSGGSRALAVGPRGGVTLSTGVRSGPVVYPGYRLASLRHDGVNDRQVHRERLRACSGWSTRRRWTGSTREPASSARTE